MLNPIIYMLFGKRMTPMIRASKVLRNISVRSAAVAYYRRIRYRPSIPAAVRCRPSILAAASKDFFNSYNNTSKLFTSSRKISCSEFFFYIFIFSIYLKWKGFTYRRICRCLFTFFRRMAWKEVCEWLRYANGLWKSIHFLLEFSFCWNTSFSP